MSSHRSTRTPRPWFTVALAWGLAALGGCGSVGPSQRTDRVSDRAFAGVECEPGLVLECEPACSRGDASACEIAGLGYLSGQAVSQDLDRARIMLERACEKGRQLACSGFAKMAEDGQGVELSAERQATLLRLGCNEGDANACHRLGKRLLGTEAEATSAASLQQAHELFAQACSGGDPQGCLQLGVEAKTGRVGTKDVVKAVTWLTDACEQEVASACYELGDLQVAAGTAVHNPARGRQNLDKACTLNSGAACAQLAQLMAAGEKDVARARTLHERACELEQWNSCFAVGHYELAASPSAAERSFDKACSAGVFAACFEQGKLLEGRTPGLEPAPDRALTLYEKACTAEVHPACAYAAKLALQQLNGNLPTRDTSERLGKWVRIGCETERDDESCLVWARWASTGEHGVTRDAKRAAALLGPLCAKSTGANPPKADALEGAAYGEACHRLARLHETGAGVEQNVLGAVSLYAKGCGAGYQAACLSQATLQWRGTAGAKRDPEGAVALFKRLCADASGAATGVGPDACVHLGYAQVTGVGTARDLAGAKERFETFCRRGHQLACAHLGQSLVFNRGTEADRKRGEGLLRSACDSANGQACFFLADLPSNTAAQRKDLLQRACQLEVAEACAFQKASASR